MVTQIMHFFAQLRSEDPKLLNHSKEKGNAIMLKVKTKVYGQFTVTDFLAAFQ